jgi:hypothetical protein
MNHKSLLNQLELGYAPLTAYEFATVKEDPMIEKALENASLYVIGQRPVITFENVIPNIEEYNLQFYIKQKDNPNVLKCKLPLIQPIVGSKDTDTIYVAFNFLDQKKKADELPLNNIHGFSLLKHNEIADNEFLIWFSPEKLLQNWWKGHVQCEIIGDFKSFTRYKVHYVGKATRQSILKRLNGHSTFQEILSLEQPVTEKQLPANEIVILPFKFQDNIQFQSFGPGAPKKDMIASFLGEDHPEQEKVFLDAEKALIKAIQPSYNKELFNNYPVSKDGLYNDNYDVISYTFIDPIVLTYEEGTIRGGLTNIGGDAILIINNKECKLVRHG